MNEQEFLALMAEKLGLPGAIIASLLWAMYRFGPTPGPRSAPAPAIDETAAAIERLTEKIDHLSTEMTDRLARVETDIANIHRAQKK